MTETISSRQHPLLKRLRAVRDRRGREARDWIFLEGPRLVSEALRSGLTGLEVLASASLDVRAWGPLASQLDAAGVRVRVARDPLLEDVSPAVQAQGLVALARRPDFSPDVLFGATPLMLVAVEIQDPGNLGGLLRTAEAAGASGAILTRGCADAFGWKALRGSMGSALRLPHVVLDLDAALAEPKARGLRLVATAGSAERSYTEADLTGPLALLVGNEGAGLPPEALAAADERIRVPLAGRAESLNVGVAAGVVLFEAARQRRAGR